MIRSLRQRHRVTVIALTVVVPAAFALGIAARREVPVSPAAAASLSAAARNVSQLWSRDELWDKRSIRTRLLRDIDAGQFAVELVSMDRIVRPDLLLYWVPGEQRTEDSLPDNAVLLGTFDQSISLALPHAATEQSGALVLYSLADHEIVTTSKPFTAQ